MALQSYYIKDTLEAGCDEAGRGCLSGPVFAAAVILPQDFHHPLLDDSKKISEKSRNILRNEIEQKAISFGVAMINNTEIDKINILNASILAMHSALDKMEVSPESILVDGNKFKSYRNIPYACIVGGDGLYSSIAAASILAKTYRDDYMRKLHNDFPDYNWKKNKGYATKEHIQAIQFIGYSPYHRRTFHLKSEQLTLEF